MNDAPSSDTSAGVEIAPLVDNIGGNCPVQACGTIAGLPFYFRARGDSWQFSVSSTVDGNPVDVHCGMAEGFNYEEDYGAGPFDAGWMPVEEALGFIRQAAAQYLKSKPEGGAPQTKSPHPQHGGER